MRPILILLVIFLYSFFPASDKRSGSNVQISTDSVNILPLRFIWSGATMATSFRWKDSAYLVFDQHYESALIIYNFNSKSIRRVELPQGTISRYFVSLYFLSPFEFYILKGQTGEIFHYKNDRIEKMAFLADHPTLTNDGLWPDFNDHQELFFNAGRIEFPVEINPEIRSGKYSALKFNYPVTAFYELEANKVGYLGELSPRLLYDKNFGLLGYVHQLITDKGIIYHCPALPEIRYFDKLTKRVSTIKVRSRYQVKEIDPLIDKYLWDKDKILDHSRRNGGYTNLVYDSFRDRYYRLFQLPLSLKNESGYFNTYKDIRYSLIVLDHDFNIIGEALLPKGCFNFFMAPAKDALYISYPVLEAKKRGVPMLKVTFSDK